MERPRTFLADSGMFPPNIAPAPLTRHPLPLPLHAYRRLAWLTVHPTANLLLKPTPTNRIPPSNSASGFLSGSERRLPLHLRHPVMRPEAREAQATLPARPLRHLLLALPREETKPRMQRRTLQTVVALARTQMSISKRWGPPSSGRGSLQQNPKRICCLSVRCAPLLCLVDQAEQAILGRSRC
jgi:hypothetical protein